MMVLHIGYCQCDCGNVSKPIRGQSLKDGYTKSCGCIKSLGNTVIKNILLKLNISFCEEEYLLKRMV